MAANSRAGRKARGQHGVQMLLATTATTRQLLTQPHERYQHGRATREARAASAPCAARSLSTADRWCCAARRALHTSWRASSSPMSVTIPRSHELDYVTALMEPTAVQRAAWSTSKAKATRDPSPLRRFTSARSASCITAGTRCAARRRLILLLSTNEPSSMRSGRRTGGIIPVPGHRITTAASGASCCGLRIQLKTLSSIRAASARAHRQPSRATGLRNCSNHWPRRVPCR